MGSFSIWHWLIVGGIALLLFGGKGKISELMGDVAKGIKSFKKGMAEDEDAKNAPATEAPRTIDHAPGAPAQPGQAAPVAAAPAPAPGSAPAAAPAPGAPGAPGRVG
jgi:sec-independent protein translocase protein TatA